MDDEIKRTTRSTTTVKKTTAEKKPAMRGRPRKTDDLEESVSKKKPSVKAIEPVEAEPEEDDVEEEEADVEEEAEAVVEEKKEVVKTPEVKPQPPKSEVIAPKVEEVVPVTPVKLPLQPPVWKKKPRTGIHYMPDGRVITGSGETVRAWPIELGGGIDKFERLTPMRDGEVDGGPPVPTATLTVRPRRDGAYDVVNATGKPINTAPLTKEEADALVNGV